MTDSRKQYLRQQIIEKAERVDEALPAFLLPAAGAAARIAGGLLSRRAVTGAVSAGARAAGRVARGAAGAIKTGIKTSPAAMAYDTAKTAVKGGTKAASYLSKESDKLAAAIKKRREKKKTEKEAKEKAKEEVEANRSAPENQQDNYGVNNNVSEACWKGYEKKGMKTMFGKRYPNCVKKKAKLRETMEHLSEEGLRAWFGNSRSKGGKPGWVQVVSGKPCARQPGQKSTPKCVSSSKRASMTPAERKSAQARKRKADPNQRFKSGAAKPTYVPTDKPKRKSK